MEERKDQKHFFSRPSASALALYRSYQTSLESLLRTCIRAEVAARAGGDPTTLLNQANLRRREAEEIVSGIIDDRYNSGGMNEALRGTSKVLRALAGVDSAASAASLTENLSGRTFLAVKPWLYCDSCSFQDEDWPSKGAEGFSNRYFYVRSAYDALVRVMAVAKEFVSEETCAVTRAVLPDKTFYETTCGDAGFYDRLYGDDEAEKAEAEAVADSYCATDASVVESAVKLLTVVGQGLKGAVLKIKERGAAMDECSDDDDGALIREGERMKSGEVIILDVVKQAENMGAYLYPQTLDVEEAEEDGKLAKYMDALKGAVSDLAEWGGMKLLNKSFREAEALVRLRMEESRKVQLALGTP